MVPLRVLSRASLADPFLHSPSNPQSFNSLPPLKVSCLSFFDRRSLFSIACSLFLQNTRGMVSRTVLRGAGGGQPRSSRSLRQPRALRVTLPRPRGDHYPFPRFSLATGLPRAEPRG